MAKKQPGYGACTKQKANKKHQQEYKYNTNNKDASRDKIDTKKLHTSQSSKKCDEFSENKNKSEVETIKNERKNWARIFGNNSNDYKSIEFGIVRWKNVEKSMCFSLAVIDSITLTRQVTHSQKKTKKHFSQQKIRRESSSNKKII